MSAWWSDLPRDRFGDSPQMADDLSALVIAGRKTASCGALASYAAHMKPTPGSRWVIENGAGEPVCVIETVSVDLRRFDEVDEAFARDEGEGDLSLAWWRDAHRNFFLREGTFAQDMTLLCERFRLVEVIAPETAQ